MKRFTDSKVARQFFLIVIIIAAGTFVFAQLTQPESKHQIQANVTPSPQPSPSGGASDTPTPIASAISSPVAKTVRVPVLMYHYIRVVEHPDQDKLGFNLSVTPTDFDTQMRYLKDNGFTTITPDDLWQSMQGKKTLAPKSILLTFDDGYADFYTTAFPILKKYQLKATAYIVTGFLSDSANRYLTWTQLRELDTSGLITIGAHTIHHVNVAKASSATQEITEPKTKLADFLGHSITSFAYPGGTYDDHAVELVKNAKYDIAFTTKPGLDHSVTTRLLEPRVRMSGGMTLANFSKKITVP